MDELCKTTDFLKLQDTAFKLDDVTKNALHSAAGPYLKKRRLEEAGGGDAKEAKKVGGLQIVPPYDGPRIPSNTRILRMMDTVKKKHTESMELLSSIKMMIQMNVPRIEDGNNFRVGVQEECISELSRVEDSCFTVLDSMSKYFATRARLVTKCLKHPSVNDYKRSIEEVDHMQAVNLRMCTFDLRNNYTILFDVLSKNDDRLEKPKDNVSMAMMY